MNTDKITCSGFDFFFDVKPTKKEVDVCKMVVSKITPIGVKSVKILTDVNYEKK
jgi:hypothetical protein